MKAAEEQEALALIRQHPGWSDRRVAAELAKRKLHASAAAVQTWRVAAGLAPATKDAAGYPPPRRPGVPLECGHLIHPEQILPTGRAGHCDYCGSDFPLVVG